MTNETEHDDSWMISSIDVFVLVSSIFVVLFVINRAEFNPENAVVSAEAFFVQPSLVQSSAVQSSVMESANTQPSISSSINSGIEFVSSELFALMSFEGESLDKGSWKEIKTAIINHDLDSLVELKTANGFAALEIQSRVLFNSGAAELARSGEALLEKLVPLLKKSKGLIFIEGHTDDQPISSNKYPSNWDLALARSKEVQMFFVLKGFEKNRLRAVSYGDTQPIAPNDTESNRRQNRRVSLLIQQ